jgi:uncharacterized MAPEG superfamily protein
MTTEFTFLVWTAILTLLIRVPWMINKVTVRGLGKVTQYPTDSEPLSRWAHRVWIAHEDAVQNLIVFAVLVIALHVIEVGNAWTRAAAAVYFWARLTHFVVYAFGITRVKTVAFVVAFVAQLVLAWQLVIAM